jgi:hypothetical protein
VSTADVQAQAPELSAAEFKAAYDKLGLTTEWLAEHLQVHLRTVQRWLRSELKVPAWVCGRMADLLAEAEETVARETRRALEEGTEFLQAYRSDEQMPDDVCDYRYPAAYYLKTKDRIAEEVYKASGRRVRVYYVDEIPQGETQA